MENSQRTSIIDHNIGSKTQCKDCNENHKVCGTESSFNEKEFDKKSNKNVRNKTVVKCPHCASKLKKTKIPSVITYHCSMCKTFTTVDEHKLCHIHKCQTKHIKRKTRYQWYCANCSNFVTPLITEETKIVNQEHMKQLIPTLRKVVWHRPVRMALKSKNPKLFFSRLVHHLTEYPKLSDDFLQHLREYMLPKDVIIQINEDTKSDKHAQKSHLAHILLWTLSYFLTNTSKGKLTIKGISNASHNSISQGFVPSTMLDHNALSHRLENENLIEGLEQTLQFTSQALGSRAFEDGSNVAQAEVPSALGYIPIYYDWVYFVKKGTRWELCAKVNKTDHGIKVGIARDWETRAIVGLVAHFTKHPGDREAFESYLMYTGRKSIIHVTDKGPFALPLLVDIDKNDQFFIMPKRENIKTILENQEFKGSKKIELNDRHTITLLEVNQVTIKTNETSLAHCKELYFKINGKSGKYQFIRLLSNLNLDSENIIRTGFYRWRATETEHRIFKQEYGLKYLFLKNPQKFWPLLLLVLISVQLLEIAFQGIHKAHGGKLNPKAFREGFCKFLFAVLRDNDEAWKHLPKCDSPLCSFGRKHGERIS